MVSLFDPAVRPPALPDPARLVRVMVSGAAEGGQVRVGDTTAFVGTGVVCLPGDEVLLAVSDGSAAVVANLTFRPGFGSVIGVDQTRAKVVFGGDGTAGADLPWVGAAPPVGALVALVWGSDGGWIAGVLSEPPTGPEPTPGPGDQTRVTLQLAPSTTWVTRGGGARPDVPDQLLQGHWSSGSQQDNRGFAVVPPPGGQAGRTCVGCRVALTRAATSHGATAPTAPVLQAHADLGPPGGTMDGPPVAFPGLARGESGQWDAPTAWGQGLIDGTVTGLALVGAGVSSYLIAPVSSLRIEVTLE